MKVKKLPGFVRNPLLVAFFQSRPGRIVSNWILQGMLYMNPVEIVYKLSLDVLFMVGWWVILMQPSTAAGWLLCMFLAHTTNWISNCQPIAMCRHFDWGSNDPRHFIEYIEGLERRVHGRSYIAAVASYGGLSKGSYKPTSDIDIRFVLTGGPISRLRAAHYCFIERLRAAVHRFPLDLYAFDLDELQRKMCVDEPPVVFDDSRGLLASVYPKTVPFGEFRAQFRRDILCETQS